MSTSKTPKKPRLGRGLSSLISTPVSVNPPAVEPQHARMTPPAQPVAAVVLASEPAPTSPAPATAVSPTPAAGAAGTEVDAAAPGLIWLGLDEIEANPYQPRRTFDEAALRSLAESIRREGVMQPVVVRRRPGGRGYQLVAGERRWRAARLAGLERLPAVPHELSDEQLAEWAVVENLHREDLDPIERAEAFAKLIQEFKLTHDEVAGRVGVERVTITNTLRLLELQLDVRELVRSNKLAAGHGRALLGLSDSEAQVAMARRAVAGGWSVRMVEAAVRRLAQPVAGPVKPAARSAHLEDLERQIAAQLQTKVHVKSGRKKGTGALTIEFFTIQQFDDLLGKLGVHLD